jgi:hypothetical protein
LVCYCVACCCGGQPVLTDRRSGCHAPTPRRGLGLLRRVSVLAWALRLNTGQRCAIAPPFAPTSPPPPARPEIPVGKHRQAPVNARRFGAPPTNARTGPDPPPAQELRVGECQPARSTRHSLWHRRGATSPSVPPPLPWSYGWTPAARFSVTSPVACWSASMAAASFARPMSIVVLTLLLAGAARGRTVKRDGK